MGSNELMYRLLVDRYALEQEKRDLDRRMNGWKEEALPLLLATNTKTFKDDELGSISVVDGTSATINKDLLIQALLNRGMEADVVAEVVEEATKVSKYQTIQFRMKNGK